MVSTVSSIDTAHEDMIHDAQMDFYGKRLATCSSDNTVRIFDVNGEQHSLVKELLGHDGPVWEVAWAHPKFGNILASCSYDRSVIIWKETASGWENVYQHAVHDSSVNSVAWLPHEYGQLMLACASTDGDISLLSCADGTWSSEKIAKAHPTGVTSVSWAPASAPGSIFQPGAAAASAPMRLVSGGCDNLVKVWSYTDGAWSASPEVLAGHSDWVRDVTWAPSIGLSSSNMLASCSQDKRVLIWTQEKGSEHWVGLPSGCFKSSTELTPQGFAGTVWRLSWSITGNILAVSAADNKVTLWKEELDGSWACVSELEQA